jgi:hypothetical protein
LAKLERVPLRNLWPHEAHAFTVWLVDNIDVLSEQLGITLTAVEREVTVGSFFLDLLAEDEQGNKVVIENQLESTDHDHLGKLLTCMSNLTAKTAVWITPDPRPEHVQAVTWLNESTPPDVRFYLVRLEAYRIAKSPPAPKFTAVAGPVIERKKTVRDTAELAERHHLRHAFWVQLLQAAKEKTRLHERISPFNDSWVAAVRGGVWWTYRIRMGSATVEFYIDHGPGRDKETKQLFETLYELKAEIEQIVGAPLEWDRRENRRYAAIR